MHQKKKELWRQICYQTGYDFANDGDYRRMMDIISRREKIPLLELPWERPWTLLDLRFTISTFAYRKLMV